MLGAVESGLGRGWSAPLPRNLANAQLMKVEEVRLDQAIADQCAFLPLDPATRPWHRRNIFLLENIFKSST